MVFGTVLVVCWRCVATVCSVCCRMWCVSAVCEGGSYLRVLSLCLQSSVRTCERAQLHILLVIVAIEADSAALSIQRYQRRRIHPPILRPHRLTPSTHHPLTERQPAAQHALYG